MLWRASTATFAMNIAQSSGATSSFMTDEAAAYPLSAAAGPEFSITGNHIATLALD